MDLSIVVHSIIGHAQFTTRGILHYSYAKCDLIYKQICLLRFLEPLRLLRRRSHTLRTSITYAFPKMASVLRKQSFDPPESVQRAESPSRTSVRSPRAELPSPVQGQVVSVLGPRLAGALVVLVVAFAGLLSAVSMRVGLPVVLATLADAIIKRGI